ncbi:putative bcas2 family protein [Diaporthe ampelina]|uniref:Putative bcas2 family protein n=1 Tax=Diaporthe ampelina TaxID=1214573 RepID=A0A0G2HQN9_9PEZI|nr:putative bcas2 family protein [Diaporthe ampelina]
MPSITTVHESLPYVDPEPTQPEREAAEALIAAERATVPDDPHHALLPPPAEPTFSPLIQAELDRIASSPDPSKPAALDAIDLSRYELPDLPGDGADADREGLESALRQAYAAATYLSARRQHLALLDSHGKNAWLVGNWQLEAELRALEREVAAARRAVDLVTLRRQRLQRDAGGEITGLDETWRRGVGRVLEAEVAAEGLRREVDAIMRQRARDGEQQQQQ